MQRLHGGVQHDLIPGSVLVLGKPVGDKTVNVDARGRLRHAPFAVKRAMPRSVIVSSVTQQERRDWSGDFQPSEIAVEVIVQAGEREKRPSPRPKLLLRRSHPPSVGDYICDPAMLAVNHPLDPEGHNMPRQVLTEEVHQAGKASITKLRRCDVLRSSRISPSTERASYH